MFKKALRAFHEPEWKKILSGGARKSDLNNSRSFKSIEDNNSLTTYLKVTKYLASKKFI